MEVFVVLYRVDNGDHHNQVEAVLTEVGEHIKEGNGPEPDGGGKGQQAREDSQTVACGGDQNHFSHQRLAGDSAADGGVEDHQHRRRQHPHSVEDGVEAATVAEVQIDVGGSQSAHGQTVADLVNQEGQGDPAQLVIPGNGGPDTLEADGSCRLLPNRGPFPDTEHGEAHKQRRENADNDGDAAVGGHGTPAQGHGAGGKHGNQHGGQGSADAGEQGGPAGKLVAGIRVRAERGHHPPVGDVMHGIGDGVEEVGQSKEGDEAPALQLCVEGGDNHGGGGQNADDQPGLEFAEAGAGTLDDIAHHRVIQGIKHPGSHHDDGHGAELSRGQLAGEEHIGQQKVGEQRIGHISANGTQREHPQIDSVSLFFVHGEASVPDE